jgi:hypothetical protein
VGDRAQRGNLDVLIRTLLGALEHNTIAGRLWIVEPGRVRAHDVAEDDR